MAKSTRHENHLLQQLSRPEYAALRADFEPVALDFKEPLHVQGKPIRHVYFPISGVVSLIVEVKQSTSIESGTIGREGMVGIPAFLGAKSAPNRALVQVPGSALRMETAKLQVAVRESDELRTLLMLYTNALMSMVAQSAACNRAHLVEQRLARWLLMTHDRVDGAEFPVTQEFLGQMLGVRRPAVNTAGRFLHERELIRYTRGRITILDRASLERVSCECYAVVAAHMRSIRLPGR